MPQRSSTADPGNPPKPKAATLDDVVTSGNVDYFDDLISNGLKLRQDKVGVQALSKAGTPELRKKIVEQLYQEFLNPKEYVKDFQDVARVALREGGNDEFVKELISMELKKSSEDKVLSKLAYVPETFKILAELGGDLNQTIPQGAYGLSGNDVGPLLVMSTSIGPQIDQEGASKIAIAKALIDAGADINAKDKSGYTALYHAINSSKWGHDWQIKGHKALAEFLKSRGAVLK